MRFKISLRGILGSALPPVTFKDLRLARTKRHPTQNHMSDSPVARHQCSNVNTDLPSLRACANDGSDLLIQMSPYGQTNARHPLNPCPTGARNSGGIFISGQISTGGCTPSWKSR